MKRTISLILCLIFLFSMPAVCSGIDYKYPGNNKVLVYAPGYDTGDQFQIADEAEELFDPNETKFFDPEWPLDERPDKQASVELVKSFGNYGTVIMQTHGWWFPFSSTPDSQGNPGFRTGTVVSWDTILSQLTDLFLFRLAISKKPNDDGDYNFVVFPSFVEKYVPSLNDTFFYLGYCHSLQNDKMWNALKSKGAKVAYGWDEAIFRSTNVAFFNELMSRMLPSGNEIEPPTAKEAKASIPNSKGLTFDNGYENGQIVNGHIVFKSAFPEWDNFIFSSPQSKDLAIFRAGDYVTVWDIVNSMVADNIKGEDGNIVKFPVKMAEIEGWLSKLNQSGAELIYYQSTGYDGYKWDFDPHAPENQWSLVSYDSSGNSAYGDYSNSVYERQGKATYNYPQSEWNFYDYNEYYRKSYTLYCSYKTKKTLSKNEKYIPIWRWRDHRGGGWHRYSGNYYTHEPYFIDYPTYPSSLYIKSKNSAGGNAFMEVSQQMEGEWWKYIPYASYRSSWGCGEPLPFPLHTYEKGANLSFSYKLKGPLSKRELDEREFNYKFNKKWTMNESAHLWANVDASSNIMEKSQGQYNPEAIAWYTLVYYIPVRYTFEFNSGYSGGESLGEIIKNNQINGEEQESVIVIEATIGNFIEKGEGYADEVDVFSLPRNPHFEQAIRETIEATGSWMRSSSSYYRSQKLKNIYLYFARQSED